MTDTSKIVSGQALMNDRRPSPEYTPEETGEFVSDQISIYVVREGDTLSGIAHMFGVTENTIRWANDLSAKSTLKKDQQLIILPISGVKYVVKKGDTLKSIASSFNADKQEILSFNNFDSETEIKAGEEIIIPNGEVTTTVSSASTKSSTSGAGKTSGSTSAYFTRPVKGGVRTQGIHGHNGVDLASSLGAPIYAAAAGKIIIAKSGGWNGGYGNYVVISHSNGTQTLYGHLNTVNVTVGQSVTQGAKIGGMGNTGDSTGVHLHFEVRGGKNPF
jgi:murein DD-endopeptidase MepM/ murein hydrolase activator NlpD